MRQRKVSILIRCVGRDCDHIVLVDETVEIGQHEEEPEHQGPYVHVNGDDRPICDGCYRSFRASVLKSLERIGGADPSENFHRKGSKNITIRFIRE